MHRTQSWKKVTQHKTEDNFTHSERRCVFKNFPSGVSPWLGIFEADEEETLTERDQLLFIFFFKGQMS